MAEKTTLHKILPKKPQIRLIIPQHKAPLTGRNRIPTKNNERHRINLRQENNAKKSVRLIEHQNRKT